MRLKSKFAMTLFALATLVACNQKNANHETKSLMQAKVDEYARFELSADLSALTEKERAMLPLLIDAAEIMDNLFWKQSYGDKDALLASITDTAIRNFVLINYFTPSI